jgi:predicted CXXCH cytochrome family protein
MGSTDNRAAGATRSLRLKCIVGLSASVVAAVLVVWWWTRSPAHPDAVSDPRLTFSTPYKNVRPDVRYVGAERCADCHGDIAAEYEQHPMGRSLAPVASAFAVEDLGANNPFGAGRFEYAVEKTARGLVHHARLRDAKGKEVLHVAEPVAFALGSGGRGRSYIIQRGQQLFQSPISWYGHTRQFDLSPGYAKNQSHFDRPIPPLCLYCHANQVDAVPGALNAYHEPIFRGHAIGCERCHGPGELHVPRQEAGETYDGADDTIVNPARLEPGLRDDVCAQCHLQGEQRTVRRGRKREEFRPGLPLPLFETIFVRHPELADYARSVGQFEQMALSRCAKVSRGALGCISCHDPHVKPAPAATAAYFRDRCVRCHHPEGVQCAAPLGQREAENGNSCIACHMPRDNSSNVIHTSVTDHRILRRPSLGTSRPKRRLGPDELPIVHFHQGRIDSAADFERDQGIALVHMADTLKSPAPALQAHRRLYQAVGRHPSDLEAREMFGLGLTWQQDFAGAQKAIAGVLAAAPDRETALFHSAQCAHFRGAPLEEAKLIEGLVKLNRNHAAYWVRLAELRAEHEEWAAARTAAERAVALSPFNRAARRVLVQALAGTGAVERAQIEATIYEALGGDDVRTGDRWPKR